MVKFYLEAIQEGLLLAKQPHMDAYITRPLGGSDVVTGLEHLEGRAVQVLVDGAVHPSRIVRAGEITLQRAGGTATVGLQFVASMITLPAASPESRGGLAAKRGWSELGVRLIHSGMPLINGVRPAERHPATLMDTPEPLFSADVIGASRGLEAQGVVRVEQDLPVPLLVSGIFGRLSVEEL